MKKVAILMIVSILISSGYYLNAEIVLADSPNTYYVANDGVDSNNGTHPNYPWKTMSKVETELDGGVISQGDDIYFKRGDVWQENVGYGGIDLKLGGTSTNPMIIGAYGTGAKPVLTNTAPNEHTMRAHNVNFGYMTIQDIKFSDATGYAAIEFRSNSHTNNIVFRNIEIYNCNGHGLMLYHVDYYKIENSLFDINNPGGHGIGIQGDTSPYKIQNGIIRNCTIRDCKDGISFHYNSGETAGSLGDNHWVENCKIYNNGPGEEGIDLVGGFNCDNILVQNCEVYGGPNLISIGHGINNVVIDHCYIHDSISSAVVIQKSDNTIIRNSVIQNWGSTKNGITIYKGDPAGQQKNINIYNNDVITYDGDDDHIQSSTDADINTAIFKNNIFYSHSQASPGRFFLYLSPSTLSNTDSSFSHNLWWRGDGGSGDNTWWTDAAGIYAWAQWQALARTDGELRVNPSISNPTGNDFDSDFVLNEGSSAIDAGDWLTTTDGGGSGTVITVHEANYFFPGLSTLGVSGDNIFIGDDTDLIVTDVDYSAETITVNRAITWTGGEAVSLSSYNGNAPDIGAYESQFIEQPPDLPVISNIIRAESDPLDTDSSVGWINITATVTSDTGVNNVMLDMSCPDSSHFNVSMIEMGSNTYYYNTNTIFSNHGSHSYYIWADDTNGNASISSSYDFSMPPNWDVDMNGECNILDFILVSNHYDETGPNGWIREDVDNNGVINVLDFVMVSQHYDETW